MWLSCLVHPDARRQGLARKLMIALEDEAQARALKLLVGWIRGRVTLPSRCIQVLAMKTTGQIPYFAMAPEGDRLDATTYMFKRL